MTDKRVALVTGGSHDIGREICLHLAQVDFAVMVNFNEDLGSASEVRHAVEDQGGEADICQGDITARSHRDLIVDYTLERFGRIDLLVNNAGVAPTLRKDILETDEKSFDRTLDVNLRSTYFLTQRVAREMIGLLEQGTIADGAIINISSIRSYTPACNLGEYCISKAGLSMTTKLFAARLAEYGIKVYEISPGIFESDVAESKELSTYYDAKLAAGMTPINRLGTSQEVGRAVAAIARGDFPFTTGAVFHVDGGWHLHRL